MTSAKPDILSLAPTRRCALYCACCYLHKPHGQMVRERGIDFFDGILEQAAAVGVKEVAMSINKFIKRDDKNFLALTVLGSKTASLHMRLSVTTNYENILMWSAAAYQVCALVSLSYDEFKFPLQGIPEGFVTAIRSLKAQVPLVNINVLLTRRVLEELKTGLLHRLLDDADSVYLLMPKGYPADFSRSEFEHFLEWLLPLLDDFSLFQRVLLDNCIKPFLHPFSAVYPHCERGHQVVAVGPSGEMAYSVYDAPFAVLNYPSEFPGVLEQMFRTNDEWLCSGKAACPWIQFHEDAAQVANERAS